MNLVTTHGLSNEFLQNFQEVTAFTPTACGRALGIHSIVVIQDVYKDSAFKPFVDVIAMEKFQAIRAQPLFYKDGSLLGMLTVEFEKPQPQLNHKSDIPDSLIKEICNKLKDLRANQSIKD